MKFYLFSFLLFNFCFLSVIGCHRAAGAQLFPERDTFLVDPWTLNPFLEDHAAVTVDPLTPKPHKSILEKRVAISSGDTTKEAGSNSSSTLPQSPRILIEGIPPSTSSFKSGRRVLISHLSTISLLNPK